MKKQLIVVRKICCYCFAKRNVENMSPIVFQQGTRYVCKNNDLCVLKMAYLKKRSKN